MKQYIICIECGYTEPNQEPGNKNCPQCEKIMKFYNLELFDGSKPGELFIELNKKKS